MNNILSAALLLIGQKNAKIIYFIPKHLLDISSLKNILSFFGDFSFTIYSDLVKIENSSNGSYILFHFESDTENTLSGFRGHYIFIDNDKMNNESAINFYVKPCLTMMVKIQGNTIIPDNSQLKPFIFNCITNSFIKI